MKSSRRAANKDQERMQETNGMAVKRKGAPKAAGSGSGGPIITKEDVDTIQELLSDCRDLLQAIGEHFGVVDAEDSSAGSSDDEDE